nr:hypothetical protein CFP56_35844 [Quercus suber]
MPDYGTRHGEEDTSPQLTHLVFFPSLFFYFLWLNTHYNYITEIIYTPSNLNSSRSFLPVNPDRNSEKVSPLPTLGKPSIPHPSPLLFVGVNPF